MLNCIIDLSHHNTVTDWNAIKAAGIRAVIHKATQGTSFVDQTYHARREQALAAGLLWGAYHFGERGAPWDQVSHFLDTVRPTYSDLLVLDFEPCGDATMTLVGAEAFVIDVFASLGRTIGLYSGMSFCTDVLVGRPDTPLKHCWLWLARYSDEPPVAPPAWETWSMWQYTDQGTVPGVEGGCDRNKFNGSLEQLYTLWGVEPVA
jgi:lysozyme